MSKVKPGSTPFTCPVYNGKIYCRCPMHGGTVDPYIEIENESGLCWACYISNECRLKNGLTYLPWKEVDRMAKEREDHRLALTSGIPDS